MNGFYPVLNEIHDKAAKELPLAELALFEHIWRKLIGWGKFEDEISISQLVEETAACRASIIHIIKKLEEKRWIVVTRQASVTNRKFTSKIAIPACPGIQSRLGWSKKQTRGGMESIPGGSLESRHTTDSSSTDSLQTSTSEAMSLVKLMQEKWPHPNPPDETRLDRMIGKYSLSVCVDAMDSTRSDMVSAPWDSIYNYMEKVAKGLMPVEPAKGLNEEELAVTRLTRLVADYRTIDGNGISHSGATLSAAINVMRSYSKWYDIIDNFGAIVGMEADEYKTLMNGGAM